MFKTENNGFFQNCTIPWLILIICTIKKRCEKIAKPCIITKNEAIDSEHLKRMVQYVAVESFINYRVSYEKWQFFYNLLSSMIPKRKIKILHGSHSKIDFNVMYIFK